MSELATLNGFPHLGWLSLHLEHQTPLCQYLIMVMTWGSHQFPPHPLLVGAVTPNHQWPLRVKSLSRPRPRPHMVMMVGEGERCDRLHVLVLTLIDET